MTKRAQESRKLRARQAFEAFVEASELPEWGKRRLTDKRFRQMVGTDDYEALVLLLDSFRRLSPSAT